MRLLVSVAALSMVLATSVSAQTPAPQPAAPSTPAEAPAGKAVADAKKTEGVICHKEVPTGSVFPVKVCTTAEQRKAQAGQAHHAQESMQGGMSTVPH